MEPQPGANQPNGNPPPPEKKRTLFDTVLTSTPVLLTVVATFMVGQSTGEMTRAQYNRAVAAQNQSKVANQWGFFQALRIRGTTYEASADVFIATRGPVAVSKESLVDYANKLEAEAQKVTDGGGLSPDALKKAAKVFQDCLTKGFIANSGKFDYTPKQVDAAFATLMEVNKPKLPKLGALDPSAKPAKKSDKEKSEEEMSQEELLEEAVRRIDNRETEKALASLVLRISDDSLEKAMAKADADAKSISDKGKKAEFVLEQVDLLVDDLAYVTRQFLRNADHLGEEEQKKIKTNADKVRQLIDQLATDFKTAHHFFNAKRYENNARGNSKSAQLYGVSVYLASARSDKHMERSKNFMYAMLVAQVGVIIASMAMAVKQKSLVWMLATLAGLVAIGFGGYVFLGIQ